MCRPVSPCAVPRGNEALTGRDRSPHRGSPGLSLAAMFQDRSGAGRTVMRRIGSAGLVAGGLLLGAPCAPHAVAAEVPVDLELVLAVDVSGSMDRDEQAIQRRGYV